MIKAALVQERAEAVKPAMANTKRVLAIRAINIPAPVPATPAAPAPLAAENIPNAIVQVIIVGMVAVVFCLVIRATNTLAPAPATRVVPGTVCGGKYTSCTCASGYEWKNGSCQKQVLNGAQGDLYYCNGTVVGVKTSNMGFYVAMKDLGYMTWSNANSQCRNYSFCGNVKGTLPTKDQLLTLYNNKSQVNSLLSTNGGTQLTNNWHWSSTAGGGLGNHYLVHMSSGNVNSYITNYGYVRPVLTSW